MATIKRARRTAYATVTPFVSPFPDPIQAERAPSSGVGGDTGIPGQMWIYQSGSTVTDAVYVLAEVIGGNPFWKSLSGGTGNGAITPASIASPGAITFSAVTNRNGVLVTDPAGLVSASNAATGYVLAGRGAGSTPTFAELTSSDGTVTIDSSVAGTIDFSIPGAGSDWTVVTATPVAPMDVNQGYIVKPAAARVDLQLPASAVVGSTIRVVLGQATFGWRITQAAGQQIFGANSWGSTFNTTAGAGGYVDCINPSTTAISQYAAIEIVCITADTTWVVRDFNGELNWI